MFENQGLQRLREMFENQFEPAGDQFVYRKSMRGLAIHISAAERDRFIKAYDTHLRRSRWWFIGAMIFLMLGLVTYSVGLGRDLPDWPLYGGLAAITLVFLLSNKWAWNAPERELRGRVAVGKKRTRSEIRRLYLAKMTYAQIVSATIGPAVLAGVYWLRGNRASYWNDLWLIAAILLLLLGSIQAFRKWRLESAQAKVS